MGNHQSSLDVLGMFDLWPVMEKCTVVAKKEIFYAWPMGLAAWLCGLIFIDRMNSEKARSALNIATKEIKEKKVHQIPDKYLNHVAVHDVRSMSDTLPYIFRR